MRCLSHYGSTRMTNKVHSTSFLIAACLIGGSMLGNSDLLATECSSSTKLTISNAICGTAVDLAGNSVSGVQLRVVNSKTAVAATVTSDRAGKFRFQALPAGEYELVPPAEWSISGSLLVIRRDSASICKPIVVTLAPGGLSCAGGIRFATGRTNNASTRGESVPRGRK
jgi:hypothetical protein